MPDSNPSPSTPRPKKDKPSPRSSPSPKPGAGSPRPKKEKDGSASPSVAAGPKSQAAVKAKARPTSPMSPLGGFMESAKAKVSAMVQFNPAGFEEAGLVEVPPTQAALLGDAFPVGCPVWYRARPALSQVESGGGPWDVRHGTVASLAMDAVTRKLVYRVRKRANHDGSADAGGPRNDLVPEDQEIVYAAMCRVTVTREDGGGGEEAQVVAPRFGPAGVTYTVVYCLEDNALRVEDGVPPARIRFRPSPADEAEPEEGLPRMLKHWNCVGS